MPGKSEISTISLDPVAPPQSQSRQFFIPSNKEELRIRLLAPIVRLLNLSNAFFASFNALTALFLAFCDSLKALFASLVAS